MRRRSKRTTWGDKIMTGIRLVVIVAVARGALTFSGYIRIYL